MCGLAGFASQKKFSYLKRAAATIAHRGPDSNGHFSHENVHLFHYRLKIIDLKGSNQPFQDEKLRYTLIYNGEIYNFKELRKNLKNLGYSFKSSGDTEVVLKLFEEYGDESFKMLNGIFAIAIYDKKLNEITLARDPFGIKPLYFSQGTNEFSFASELKVILAAYPEFKKNINYNALNYLLTFKFLPEEETMLTDIRKLKPGHILKFNTNTQKFEIKQYVNLIETFKSNKETNTKEFYEKFKKTVESQMLSDVPLGVYLSGGIDSSAIAATMRDIAPNKDLLSFSVIFPGEKMDESNYSSLVAKKLETKHCKLKLKTGDFLKFFPKIIWHLEEPFSDPATLPIYMLSEQAKKKVTVVLTGEGSDELLLGYKKYKLFIILNLLRLPLIKQCVQIFIKFFNKNSIYRKIIEKDFNSKTKVERILNTHSSFPQERHKKLLNKTSVKRISKTPKDYIKHYFQTNNGFLRELQYFDIRTWMVNDPIIKLDKMLMAHGVEGRVPFLDLEFSKYVLNLRNKYKVSRFLLNEKNILKKALKGKLPSIILKRKKHSFDVPIHIFKKEIKSILNKEAITKRGIFNYKEIEQILEENWHYSGTITQIWLLVCIELWFKLFIDTNMETDNLK